MNRRGVAVAVAVGSVVGVMALRKKASAATVKPLPPKPTPPRPTTPSGTDWIDVPPPFDAGAYLARQLREFEVKALPYELTVELSRVIERLGTSRANPTTGDPGGIIAYRPKQEDLDFVRAYADKLGPDYQPLAIILLEIVAQAERLPERPR